jgi:hypothetical protein
VWPASGGLRVDPLIRDLGKGTGLRCEEVSGSRKPSGTILCCSRQMAAEGRGFRTSLSFGT